MTAANGNNLNQRLDSWKEIAAYLSRDERTAIRWEKDKGLPVHRVPGGKRQAVFAYADELDSWLRQKDASPSKPHESAETAVQQAVDSRIAADETDGRPPRFAEVAVPPPSVARSQRLLYPLFAILGFVIAGAFIMLHSTRVSSSSRPAPVPARIGYTLNSVQAFDNENQLLWNYPFPRNIRNEIIGQPSPFANWTFIADYRGDGLAEALVPVVYVESDDVLNYQQPSEVDLISSEGKLLWSYVPKESFQFGKHLLDGKWYVTALLSTPHDKSKTIWASFGHGVWGNTFVMNLDPASGAPTLRYVNTGTVHVMKELVSQKRFLLVGGFNNESDSGSLGVVDEDKPFAASPQTMGTRHECVTCPNGAPDYYFVFPRSEITDLRQIHEEPISDIQILGKQVEVIEGSVDHGDAPSVHYEIRTDENFRLSAIRFDSVYDMLHRRYEREGKLNHTLENCPERLHPKPVKMWTPASGWTEIHLDPTPYNQ